jgi:hypothetical protein
MSEQQAAALRVATRTLNDLADVVEDGLPTLDQSNYDQVIEDVSATDTPFAERWAGIKACVDDHFEHLSLDESLDSTIYDYVGVSGGYPPENRELTISIHYYPEGRLKTEIGVHDEPERRTTDEPPGYTLTTLE